MINEDGKLEIFLLNEKDGLAGYDLCLLDPSLSVTGYLDALADFFAVYLADCRGCDGCCYERVPLTSLDIGPLAALLPPNPYPAGAVLSAFACLRLNKEGAADIYLRRGEDGACLFLKEKICTIYQARPFVCRSHFCLKKSPRAEALRGAIVNPGMDQLIRTLLEEKEAGSGFLLEKQLDPADYPANAFAGKSSYQELSFAEVLPEDLMRELCLKCGG